MKNIFAGLLAIALALPLAAGALPGYDQNADTKLNDWSAANEQVQKAGGWKAYAKEIADDQKAKRGESKLGSAPTLTLQAAMDRAMALNPALTQTLATINGKESNYLALSPHQREALSQRDRLLANVKLRYFAAVAAQEQANYKETINETAAVAAELALRMRKVGNLNFAHQAEEQLSHAKTAVAFNNARLKASAAKDQLAQHLGFAGRQAEFTLPSRLPDLPQHFPAPSDLTQILLSEVHPTAGEASSSPASLRARGEARQALASAENAYRIAKHYRDEVLPLRKKLSEETLLRYNGMLIGVFDLLSDATHQIEAVESYLEALHSYWVADAKLTVALAELKEDGAQFRRSAWTR
ncbi:hypothetical protein AOB54_05575 [beta proteobacterium MWH-UniP1]